jgi:hypothetical protein
MGGEKEERGNYYWEKMVIILTPILNKTFVETSLEWKEEKMFGIWE